MVNTEAPQNSITEISDEMFLVQSTPSSLISIFVHKIISSVFKLTQQIADLCFAVYEPSSIKDTIWKDRRNEESNCIFCIGPKTKMETAMHDLLGLSCFK